MSFASKGYPLFIPPNGELWNHEDYVVVEGEVSWVLNSTNHDSQALVADNRKVSR